MRLNFQLSPFVIYAETQRLLLRISVLSAVPLQIRQFGQLGEEIQKPRAAETQLENHIAEENKKEQPAQNLTDTHSAASPY